MSAYDDLIASSVGYWPLQDNAGTTNVVGLYGGNLTWTGGGATSARSVAGPRPWLPLALNLGKDRYAARASNLSVTGPWSVAFWLHYNDPDFSSRAATHFIFAGALTPATVFRVYVGINSNVILWSLQGGETSFESGNALAIQGGWHHICFTGNSVDTRVYLDSYLNHVAAPLGAEETHLLRIGSGYGNIPPAAVAGFRLGKHINQSQVTALYNGPPAINSSRRFTKQLLA